MNTKVASYNMKVRVLLFFIRPFHVFNVILLFKMWNYMSYAPSTFKGYYTGSAAHTVEWLWQEQFSPYIWYFLIVALVDMAVQEFLPLIGND